MAGETRALTAAQASQYYDIMVSGIGYVTFNVTFTTTDNQLADVVQAGMIGINHTPIQYWWYPTDMDTGTTVVHKVTVGGVDIVVGLTGAQTGVVNSGPCSALITTTTNPALVQITTSTAATTAVAGSGTLILACIKRNI